MNRVQDTLAVIHPAAKKRSLVDVDDLIVLVDKIAGNWIILYWKSGQLETE